MMTLIGAGFTGKLFVERWTDGKREYTAVLRYYSRGKSWRKKK